MYLGYFYGRFGCVLRIRRLRSGRYCWWIFITKTGYTRQFKITLIVIEIKFSTQDDLTDVCTRWKFHRSVLLMYVGQCKLGDRRVSARRPPVIEVCDGLWCMTCGRYWGVNMPGFAIKYWTLAALGGWPPVRGKIQCKCVGAKELWPLLPGGRWWEGPFKRGTTVYINIFGA